MVDGRVGKGKIFGIGAGGIIFGIGGAGDVSFGIDAGGASFGVGAGVAGGESGFMVGNEPTIFCSGGRGGTRAGLFVSSTNPLAS